MARNLNTTEFELPIGYCDKDGVWHTRCVVSEIVGSDEEAITDKKVASNPVSVITTLLARKIQSIGTIEKVTPLIVRNMFSADRDAALVEIRKLSLGEEMKFSSQCDSCREKSLVTVDLSKDLDIVFWDEKENKYHAEAPERGVLEFSLISGYEDDDGEIHKDGFIKLTNGVIEEQLRPIIKQNSGKANTALLCASIISLGNLKMVDTKVLRELTRRDREYLTSLLRDGRCGPKMYYDVECAFCGASYIAPLELPYFFTANSDL